VDIEEYKKLRVEGREQLLEKIINTFIPLNPVAIHQFGSGPKGYKDEFSDIDVWITFKDSQIPDITKTLSRIFAGVAPVLVKHHSRTWSPVGGNSSSIIHRTKFGLFLVDYYVSQFSETIIPKGSKILWGNDLLKIGEWKLNKNTNPNIHDSHTLKKDIDLLLDLIFVGVKGVARKWDNNDFLRTLKFVHQNFLKRNPGRIKRRRISLDFKSFHRLLSDLGKVSNKRQRLAIENIKNYLGQVDDLYLSKR